MDRRTFIATSAGIATAAVAGCSVRGGDQTDDYDVGMTASEFRPAVVTVAPGSTVVWKNTSSHGHTVTAYEDEIPSDASFFASGDFESQSAAEQGWRDGNEGVFYQGEAYRHTFEEPGEYPYYCIPHESVGMAGTVTVSESTDSE